MKNERKVSLTNEELRILQDMAWDKWVTSGEKRTWFLTMGALNRRQKELDQLETLWRKLYLAYPKQQLE